MDILAIDYKCIRVYSNSMRTRDQMTVAAVLCLYAILVVVLLLNIQELLN